MRVLFAFALAAVFLECVDAYRPINAHKQWFRYPGNAGVKIRLTKKGANHIKTVGVQLFNDYVANLKDYSTDVPFNQIGMIGVARLSNLRIKNYHPPQLSVLNFLPTRYIVLGLENLDLSLSSHFFASAPPLQFEGSLDGSIVGMTIALTAELLATQTGSMSAIVRNCSAIVARSHVILNPVGPMGIFLKTFEGMINDSVRQRIPEILCAKLQTAIEKHVGQMFDKVIRMDLMDQLPRVATKNGDLMQSFMAQLSNGMFLDNRLMAHPYVTFDFIETNHQGIIEYDQSAQTPFYPRAMENLTSSEDRMLHIYISDHLLNSLLYHAYQDNRLSMKIENESLPAELKGFVGTSCPTVWNPSNICVGRLIPQIGKSFPNATTSFVILPHGLPYVRFTPDGATIETTNRVLTYLENYDERVKSQILVFSINGQAVIGFVPNDGILEANLSLNRFNVRLHRSSIRGVDETSISKLSPLAKTFIAPRLNRALQKAIKLPMQETMRFMNPQVRTFDGYMQLSTDFELNAKRMKMMMGNVTIA
ncbi:unnamed protein product [Caenorhabditis bovis]|uniref:Lipid-binding serum glycoprotein C-terminal domain-containing protein n=1 Tax=Caenorhabditis bovis TaxID=2654633 RepID=A0A8S1ELN0_9PELO|nr:unnamed protein product [Caenorhabditis bovis]